MTTNKHTALTLALGSAVCFGLSTAPASAAENPFSAQVLDRGYMVAEAGKGMEGKCGEGKCGGKKDPKAKEAKCGEGKCGGKSKSDDMKADQGKTTQEKAKEGKCGEGKCGAKPKAKEGKCGEGKCGGKK